MKNILILAMVAMIVSGALAQGEDNMLGLFFAEPYISENTNFDPGTAPFPAYIVLFNPTVDTVGGYEVGIDMPPAVFILTIDGPNDWTNFGSNLNHLCGFQIPLPPTDGGTVLCEMQFLYQGGDVVFIAFGPADPPSLPGAPVISDGLNPDLLYPCNLTSDVGYVATINADGVVATEHRTLSGVKALFD